MYEPILHLQLDLWSEFCESDTLFTKNSCFIVVKRKIFVCSQDIELRVEVWLKDLHWRRAVWEALGRLGEALEAFGQYLDYLPTLCLRSSVLARDILEI